MFSASAYCHSSVIRKSVANYQPRFVAHSLTPLHNRISIMIVDEMEIYKSDDGEAGTADKENTPSQVSKVSGKAKPKTTPSRISSSSKRRLTESRVRGLHDDIPLDLESNTTKRAKLAKTMESNSRLDELRLLEEHRAGKESV